MIVRNEEQNLAECLGPVAELFDEIIIVDTGSRDRTKEIAKRFTPHVHDFPWCDDFSAARNESLRHATGDWIFWLDADDRILPPHIATIRQILTQLDNRPRVYFFKTVLVPGAPGVDRLFVSHRRLFRRHPDLRWRGRVHEQLGSESVFEHYQKIVADVEIEHIGYLDSVLADRKARLKLRLLRMDYAVNPGDVSTLLHLGTALHMLGNDREAKRCFLRILNENTGPHEYMRRVCDMLIELSCISGDVAGAASFVERGLTWFPNDEILLLARAKLHYLRKDFASSIRAAEHLIEHARPRELHYQTPDNVKTRLAPLLLAAAYRMQRDYYRAEQVLQELIAGAPTDCEALFNLGMVYLDQANWPPFVALVSRLASTSGGETGAAVLTAKMLLRHGELRGAAQLIDQIIAKEPFLVRARLLRMEYLSRAQQPLEVQIRAHRDLLRISPDNLEARAWLENVEKSSRHNDEPPISPLALVMSASPAAALQPPSSGGLNWAVDSVLSSF